MAQSAQPKSGLRIERVPVAKVQPAKYNPRKDLQPGDPEYEKLRRSIERWDLVEPLVWNERTGNLVGGHQRFKILLARGDPDVPVSIVDLDENDEAALNVALNKIGGEWDVPKLADLLSELDAHGFDSTLTGFDTVGQIGAETGEIGGLEYQVVVTAADEHEQGELCAELEARGLKCRLLTL